MANHLTPGELADQLQMERQEVIGKCVEMGVPIFHGRIDRTLFETSLRQPTARRDRGTLRAPRSATELDSPPMEGRGTHSKTLADLLPLAAELYGDAPGRPLQGRRRSGSTAASPRCWRSSGRWPSA